MDRPGQLLRDRISGHSDPRQIEEALRFPRSRRTRGFMNSRATSCLPARRIFAVRWWFKPEAELYDQINRFREKRAGHTTTVAIEPFLDALTRERHA